MKGLIILSLSFLYGCAPYVSYTHLDSTPLHNDGLAWNLICGGIKTDGVLTYRLAVCENVTANRSTFLKIDIEYSP